MIALFGGTFDPIHNGHLNMAHECLKQCKLTLLNFMPCAIPAHKAAPGVSDNHRIEMLKLALAPYPEFAIDLREMQRRGPSYTLLSLQELRAEHPNEAILFLIGMDSFNNLTRWFHWQEIVNLCHIVVYQRPGQTLAMNAELETYYHNAKTTNVTELHTTPANKLYFLSGEQLDIASSDIRKDDKKHELLPAAVSQYIKQHQLYQTGE